MSIISNMKRIKKILAIFVIIIFILSIISVASADHNATISIRSKFVKFDKNWNTEILCINITIDKLGRLAYIESYYTEGSEGPKLLSTNRYYDANITDNSISFEISRPRSKSGTAYYLIHSVVLLDNEIVFEKWLDMSNKFTLIYTNRQYPVKDNRDLISDKNIVNNTKHENDSGVARPDKKIFKELNQRDAEIKKSPGFESVMLMTTILAILGYRDILK